VRLAGEREGVLESDPVVGPDPVVRDPALVEQLHQMRARDVHEVGSLLSRQLLAERISESASPADISSATRSRESSRPELR
jgi:hypothetical protein